MFNSIKLKIIIWCLAIFSIVFAGLEVFLYYQLEAVAIGLVDEHVRSETETMSSILKIEMRHGQLETELVELSLAAKGKYLKKFSGRYYQIVSSKGKIVATSPSLYEAHGNLPILPATADGLFYTVNGPAGQPMRLFSRSVDLGGTVLIFQVADSLTGTYRLVKSFRRVVFVVYPMVFVICALGIYLMTKWALAPMRDFAAKVSHITEKNLYERIDEKHKPIELKALISGFNVMLGHLEGSFERKKQFLSDASHELRTPTSVIKSYCDVMLTRERDGEVYKGALQKISTTVNRMAELINRILVISRIDSNSAELKPVRFSMEDMIKGVFRLMEQAASSRRISLRVEGPDVEIQADRDGVLEVFTNLVENAIKYNRDGGSVVVRISGGNGFCEVAIEDTGIGIVKKDIENIFKRFYRTDASRGLTVGSGLGLSIVSAIVNAHGGHIDVVSEKGRGSIFKIFLPISIDV